MVSVLTGKLTFKSLESLDLTKCTKIEIREYFENAYDLNDSLFTSLINEDVFYKCPDRLRMPLIFYYGHTASVYVNKLVLADLLKPEERVNMHLDTIFETGVNELSWDDIENYRLGSKYIWPSLVDVVSYRRDVRKLVCDVIERTPLDLPINWDSKWWAVIMGIEHERIHFETSSVLIRQLPVDFTKKPKDWVYGPTEIEKPFENLFIRVDHAKVILGSKRDSQEFGWDNEFGFMEVLVPSFEVSDHLTTNEEFCDFVNDGGYEDERFWSKEGWKWVTFQQAKHPTFWICDQECKTRCGKNLSEFTHCPKLHEKCENGYHREIEKYKFRCMFDVIDMPTNWPVEVNYHEAKAFCKWKSYKESGGKYLYRLLSEAEYKAIRKDANLKNGSKRNINLVFGSSTPVNMYAANELGIHDEFGNVWHWLEDHFNGLPGFETHYLYHDYSYPYFEGLHTLIAGGSWSSTGTTTSPYVRSTFRRHFFQHLGFRLVKQLKNNCDYIPIKVLKNSNREEIDYPFDDEAMNDLCLKVDSLNDKNFYKMSKDEPNQIAPELIEASARTIINVKNKFALKVEKFLLIGCDIGDIIFKLEGHFQKAIGVDQSISIIERSKNNQIKNRIKSKFTEAEIYFKQLSWMPNELAHQDLVVYWTEHSFVNPTAWSRKLLEIVNVNGLLIVMNRKIQDDSTHTAFIEKNFMKVEEHIVDRGNCSTIYIAIWKHKN